MVSVMRFDESSSLGLELDRMIGVGSVENESFVCNYDLPKVPLTRWKSSEIAALAPSSEGQSGVGAQLELDECDAQQNGLLLGGDPGRTSQLGVYSSRTSVTKGKFDFNCNFLPVGQCKSPQPPAIWEAENRRGGSHGTPFLRVSTVSSDWVVRLSMAT